MDAKLAAPPARRDVLSALLLVTALLLGTARPASADVLVEVAPTGTPGVFEFVATGFEANEMVSTWLTGPSQQVVPTSRYKVDHKGGIAFIVRLKRHQEPGRWAITVGGWESGREGIATFDLPPRPPDIALAVSPSSGSPGTAFNITAVGFEAGERVSYWLTAPDGQVHEGDAADAGADGRIAFVWATTAETPVGEWTVTAYGQSSDRLGMAHVNIS